MQSPYNLNSVMSRLHARQLRLLIAVAEQGSLLAAADRVGLTQPGASKALKELESTLNAPLFMRTNRGLVPTEAGTCAVRFARLIQSDISHLQQKDPERTGYPTQKPLKLLPKQRKHRTRKNMVIYVLPTRLSVSLPAWRRRRCRELSA